MPESRRDLKRRVSFKDQIGKGPLAEFKSAESVPVRGSNLHQHVSCVHGTVDLC